MNIKTESFFRDAAFVLFADIVLFKRITVTVGVIALLVAFLVPPTYDIGGRILVESKQLSLSPDSLGATAGYNQVLPSTPQDVETEVSLLLSPQFFKFAAGRMREQGVLPASHHGLAARLTAHVRAAADTVREGITALTGFAFTPPEDLLWKELIESVDAEQMPGTNLVQLHYYTRSPEEDLKPARLLMESFLLFRQNQGAAAESSFYGAKLKEYEQQYADLERRKVGLLQEMELAGDVNQEITRLIERINAIDDLLIDLTEKRNTSTIWLKYIQHTSKELVKQKKELNIMPPFPLNFESSDIKEINMRLFDLILEYIRISSTFTDTFDQSKGARQNLRSLERYILKMCENETALRKTQLDLYESQIREKEAQRAANMEKLQHLKKVAPELSILTEQVAALQNVIQTFIRRSEEAHLQSEAGSMLQMPSVRIGADPSVPERPYFPRKRIVIPLGVAGGILLALLAVFTRHMLRRRFVGPHDVQAALGLPTLASIRLRGYETPSLSVLWRLDDAFPRTAARIRRTWLYGRLAARLGKGGARLR